MRKGLGFWVSNTFAIFKRFGILFSVNVNLHTLPTQTNIGTPNSA